MRSQEQTREKTSLLESAPELLAPSDAGSGGKGPGLAGKLARYLTMPLILGLTCLGLYLWVGGLELDSIEGRSLNAALIIQSLVRHLEITAVATLFVVAIAVTAGVVLTRPALRWLTPYVSAVGSTGQAVPAIGVLVLIVLLLGESGFRVAVFGLVLYAFLPILRNTVVGIDQVDRSIVESARGMGMTKTAVLFRIELPLAVPIMLAGIRTALIIVVGTATLATFINAGGMGDIINTGIKTSRESILITGSVLTAVLALGIDYLAGIAEDVLRPKGL